MTKERELPNYEVVPLRSDEIVVAAVQMTKKNADPKDLTRRSINDNIDHLCQLVDMAVAFNGHIDLLVFPEMTIQGYGAGWTRDDWLNVAVENPGPELDRIGQLAKKHNCYLCVAVYTKEKEWPGHYFNAGIIFGPEGRIVLNHWKARTAPQKTAYATTIHDVLDEFIKRNGWDAVWPVARTDIGNLAVYICSEGFQTETARAYAFKGAEILCRPYGGWREVHSQFIGVHANVGDPWLAMRVDCQQNNCWGILCDSYSIIIDDYGRIVKAADPNREQVVVDRIPIAAFRKRHSIPALRKELYAPVYNEYIGKYPANLFSRYLPKDSKDNRRYHTENANW
ncbi:MAG: nitrilase-related carbon-nitrogen hydrolase [Chloroflexota bacterium]